MKINSIPGFLNRRFWNLILVTLLQQRWLCVLFVLPRSSPVEPGPTVLCTVISPEQKCSSETIRDGHEQVEKDKQTVGQYWTASQGGLNAPTCWKDTLLEAKEGFKASLWGCCGSLVSVLRCAFETLTGLWREGITAGLQAGVCLCRDYRNRGDRLWRPLKITFAAASRDEHWTDSKTPRAPLFVQLQCLHPLHGHWPP